MQAHTNETRYLTVGNLSLARVFLLVLAAGMIAIIFLKL
jgi:hypothetical protein